MNSFLEQKLENSPRPRKILNLDGGGVRGILTLGILKKLEQEIRKKHNQSIGEYYDLIAGTSTGAIIAAGLAIGKSVDELTALYLNLGQDIFGKGRKCKIIPRNWTGLRALFKENYSSENLEGILKSEFKEITIGDTENIVCGLAINAKRADTYSLWTVANHPDGKYYHANKHLKLWELCRASSAAPYYFKPKILRLRTRNKVEFDAAFIDGGVSLANNPSWVSFLTTTVGTFGFKWDTGTESLHICSVGTGSGVKKEKAEKFRNLKALNWANRLPDLFMTDAMEMNQILLEGVGVNKGKHHHFIDSQFSDEDKSYAPFFRMNEKLFSFERHNVVIGKLQLAELGFEFSDDEIGSLVQMDYYENMDTLLVIGKKYAETAEFYV